MSVRNLEVLAIGTAAYDFSLFIEEFPGENSKSEIHDMLEAGGGPAANAAYLLSLWGARCGFAGLLGDDYYGDRIRSEFESVGTDLSLTETRVNHPTPISFVLVNTRTGSRTIVNRKAPQGALVLRPSQLADLSPRVLLVDGHELEACRTARESFPQAASILDAGSLRPGTRAMAGMVDYLVASERFALQATGLADLASADQWQDCLQRLRTVARPDATIVVTLGERGLIFEGAGLCHHLPAYPVRAVDTTGAGDVFHGAFAYAILRGLPLELTLRVASLAAALSVRERGGRRSIPSLDAVRKEFKHVDGRNLPDC
ncbi:MAG: PfkB family carbohydrate kinase [Terriglobia bacterium]|jgi:sugar/nucleoside kinase (ribokinase family)